MKKLIFTLLLLVLPFVSLAREDYSSVDFEIFQMQKNFIKEIGSSLQINTLTGTKQVGNMDFSTKIRMPGASGSVSLGLDNYDITLDGRTGDASMKYRGQITFRVETEKYEYDSTLDDYKKKLIPNTGRIGFDLELLTTSKYQYIKLIALTGMFEGDEDIKKDFDESFKKATKYIGKTIRITPITDPTFALEINDPYAYLRETYNTLQSSPLFSVVRMEKDGNYKLKLNTKTIKKLGWGSVRSSDTNITYSNKDGKKAIRLSPKKDAKNNYIILSESNGRYSLDGKVYEKKRGRLTDVVFTVTKDMVSARAKTSDGNMNLLWKDENLNLEVSSPKTEWSEAMSFRVSGPLTRDMKTANLEFFWNDDKVAYFTASRSGNTGQYRGNINISKEAFALLLDLSGFYTESRDIYTITPPTIYEVLEEIDW